MSRNQCSDVQNGYKTILERSSTHLVRFWKLRQPQDHSNLGWIDDCTYFPFHANSNKTNNIQSDHQHSLSRVDAAENYHPIIFFLRCLNPGLGSPLVNKSPSCSVVEILSNLIQCFTISSQNQIVFV